MRKFAFLLLAVVLVVGLWAAGWFYAAGQLQATVADLATRDGRTAPQLTCDQLGVSGFPFRFDLDCTGATLVDGDITVTLAGLRASVLAYNPTHAIVSAATPASYADAFTGSRGRLDFTRAEASIRLRVGNPLAALNGEDVRIARASLVADGVKWIDTLAGDTLQASAGRLELHLLDVPERHDPAQGLSTLAVYATAATVMAPGLGIADGKSTLEAEITALPDDLRGLTAPGLVPRWQAAGGQLQLLRLEGTAGPDYFETSGTIALDSAARPEGQLKLTSKGVAERLGAILPPELQRLILGAQAADGSYSQTLTLRGGLILSGLIPLGMLPPLF